MNFQPEEIEKYCWDNTTPEPKLLQELAQETREKMQYPQMLTGRLEGRFLKLLVGLSGAKEILEVGTFTGYSALSLAEALPTDGRLITCEVDPGAAQMAKSYFARSPHGQKIELRLGPALSTIASIDYPLDLAFIDADKENYVNYYEAILPKVRSGGLMVFDNALWSGTVLNPKDEESLAIDTLNKRVSSDSRVESVLLTVRDGVHLVRKR